MTFVAISTIVNGVKKGLPIHYVFMPSNTERFHFLDGLRGIASLLIVIHHTFTTHIVAFLDQHGWSVPGFLLLTFTQSGVELFFVLSGVVLLRPYLRSGRRLDVKNFYYRRFRRIYPPYAAALVFGAAVVWVILAFPTWYSEELLPFSFRELVEQAFIFNFDGVYFNIAWWSLQIEILFYILVPVIIHRFAAARRFSYRRLWLLITLTLLLTTCAQVYLDATHPHIYSYHATRLIFYKFIDYPICFLLGVYLAASDSNPKEAVLFILAGILLIAASWFFLPFGYAGCGLVYAGMIVLMFQENRLKRLFERPLFVWLGERSFSLFLTHVSVIHLLNFAVSNFLPGRNLLYGAVTRLLMFPVCLFAAMLLFQFVERRYARGLQTANRFWPWSGRKKEKPDQAAVTGF
ncbi:acyltransferase family protein [Larkinella terrae]|uniref:Acyltransferase family protein n=1 Tax=Larkinella terrae TaxID=2025311 RepID=A0A7K0EEN9_9BACT|nr:acyltransferase [Larkinella terrae]MRS59928.1 acyltransferase family protein [Larkinella terrae]